MTPPETFRKLANSSTDATVRPRPVETLVVDEVLCSGDDCGPDAAETFESANSLTDVVELDDGRKGLPESENSLNRTRKPHDSENLYEAMSNQWIKATGADNGYTITPEMWAMIRRDIDHETRVLEIGSGLSTLLIQTRQPAAHDVLECSPHWFQYLAASPFKQRADLHLCELIDDPAWYAFHVWDGYDVVLIDGPTGDIGRDGVLHVIDAATKPRAVVYVDDTHRVSEMRMSTKISEIIGAGVQHVTTTRRTDHGLKHKFTRIG